MDPEIRRILEELEESLDPVSSEAMDGLIREILRARRVVTVGRGRSGLMASAFAQRLMHLGVDARTWGEPTLPAVAGGDLVVACSGTGTTASTLAVAQAAKEAGALIAAVTRSASTPLARMSRIRLILPATVEKSVQPQRSVFEQSLLVVFDALVIRIAARLKVDAPRLAMRHSNLE